MIKRTAYMMVTLLLVIITTGISVHQHYCKGHLVETNLFHDPESCCGEDGDCCSNLTDTYQFDQDYTYLIQDLNFDMPSFDLQVQELSLMDLAEESSEVLPIITDHHPPDRSQALALLQVYCL